MASPAPPAPHLELAIPANLHPAPTAKRLDRMKTASWWRSKFWGLVFSLFSDGISTAPGEGRPAVPLGRRAPLPAGPLIIVANHSSHLDTVAIAATIGRLRPLLFIAAADYWVLSKVYLWAAQTFAGIWPVRRYVGGMGDLLKAGPTVRAGVVLVMFPEGTRSRNGELGAFKRGAFELAAMTGARILPVGIVGTNNALPAHANWMRRAPIEIRWGAPFEVNSREEVDAAVARARDDIGVLTAAPAVAAPGAGWTRIRRIAFSWVGLAVVAGWAFAEGMFWPLLAEMPLLLLVVTVGRSWRGPLLIAVSAFASAAGILSTWFLVSHGIDTPTPLTTPRMHEVALQQLQHDPDNAFWNQMWNGIPVKVYAHATGLAHMSFVDVVGAIFPRLLRIAIVGGSGWLLGGFLSRVLKPCLGFVQVFGLMLFPVGLGVVILWWS